MSYPQLSEIYDDHVNLADGGLVSGFVKYLAIYLLIVMAENRG